MPSSQETLLAKRQARVAKRSFSGRVPGGLWRAEVLARVGRFRGDLKALETSPLAPVLPSEFLDSQIKQPLDRAEYLAYNGHNPVEWWSGSQIEAAWWALRQAEENLVRATSDKGVIKRYGASALAHARGRLADDDPRVTDLTGILPHGKPEDIRAAALEVLREVHEVSDRQHQTQRQFRNTLRVLTITLTLGGVALAAMAMVMPTFPLGVIGVPKNITGGDWLPIAMAAGAIGALISAVPSLAQMTGAATSFDSSRQQALLKIVVGAWSGPVGLIVMTAGLGTTATATASTTAPDTTFAGFILSAALFGVGQEALTRFADTKATNATPTTST